MATIFGDSKGLLLIDYLPPKNGQYQASLLLKLRDTIKEIRRGMLTWGSLAVAQQRSGPQVHDCTGGCWRLWLRTVRPPCIQSRPHTQ